MPTGRARRSTPALLATALTLALAADPARGEPAFVGTEVCIACHEDMGEPFGRTIHGKLFNAENALSPQMELGCEACHGPGAAHVEAGGGKGVGDLVAFSAENAAAVDAENAACLGCHSGGARLYWERSSHDGRGLACTSCHSSHQAHSERGQLRGRNEVETCRSCHLIQSARQLRNSRMPLREGHMSCGTCHNPHGAVSDGLIRHNTVNDNCTSCHAEKRGPFLWEHPPVSEDCLSCHDPHGSSKRAMLKVNQPRLCQQCHVAVGHPSNPGSPGSRFVTSGGCSNCHPQVHGSNHPSGFLLSR